MSFTCVEMRDREHAPEARCSPEGLLQQILELSEEFDIPVAGENALQRYDYEAFDRIIQSAFGQVWQGQGLDCGGALLDRLVMYRVARRGRAHLTVFMQAAQKNSLAQLTFLRMGDLMFDQWDAFSNFILRMRR